MNRAELTAARMGVFAYHTGRINEIIERFWDELPEEFKRDFGRLIDDVAARQKEIEP